MLSPARLPIPATPQIFGKLPDLNWISFATSPTTWHTPYSNLLQKKWYDSNQPAHDGSRSLPYRLLTHKINKAATDGIETTKASHNLRLLTTITTSTNLKKYH